MFDQRSPFGGGVQKVCPFGGGEFAGSDSVLGRGRLIFLSRAHLTEPALVSVHGFMRGEDDVVIIDEHDVGVFSHELGDEGEGGFLAGIVAPCEMKYDDPLERSDFDSVESCSAEVVRGDIDKMARDASFRSGFEKGMESEEGGMGREEPGVEMAGGAFGLRDIELKENVAGREPDYMSQARALEGGRGDRGHDGQGAIIHDRRGGTFRVERRIHVGFDNLRPLLYT
jgi:hypothetical protein